MKKKHNGSQIVTKLKKADDLLGRGKSLSEVCKELEISKRNYHRWNRMYSGKSPDAIESLRALRKERIRLILKIIVVSVVVFCLMALLLGYAGPYFFLRIFDGKFKFRECEPAALVSGLEKAFDISFPAEIKEIKTARTLGGWDSYSSDYLVKFSADPNTVDAFLESFPMKITLKEYKYDDDDRRLAPSLGTPNWFTQTIKEGKKASLRSDIEIYIDTTDKSNFVVYLTGYYSRDPNEIRDELKKN